MTNLRIPGPTPCPSEVLQAMGRQMVNHRGGEFMQIMQDTTAKLKKLFLTQHDLFILTGSGTGGLEAAVVNTLSPGDRVLAVSIGVFGDRFGNIAKTFGADVTWVKSTWGQAADINAVKDVLAKDPALKAVLVTHNETSTGITNPLKEIAAAVKAAGKLLLVDAISSLGSLEFPVDEWGADVVVAGSQKSWMVPPGLVMVSVSPEAWQANEQAKMARFYWDFGKAKKYFEKGGQTPWTPAVSVVFALSCACDMMLAEGLPNIISRHARLGQMTREGVKALGLKLFADEKYASNTVTAVLGDNGLDAKKLTKVMREEYDIVLSGGQMELEGKIFRIGHLGWAHESDIQQVLDALKTALPKAGFQSV
ncbi:MAG: alanine--glyoxylate aminotransferase family protein [Dehalococcoidia bacterium]|nr:alanine--glyoxylate aminotransferase family protein [Dehalococcoidia bacterium]